MENILFSLFLPQISVYLDYCLNIDHIVCVYKYISLLFTQLKANSSFSLLSGMTPKQSEGEGEIGQAEVQGAQRAITVEVGLRPQEQIKVMEIIRAANREKRRKKGEKKICKVVRTAREAEED